MIPTERPLDNPINWSFRVARVRAIDVRVHVAFLLAAVIVIWMQLPPVGSELPWSITEVLANGLGTYALLFAVVLLHEFGHCYGARRTGGEANEILLWPLGGLAYVRPLHDPRAHLITAMAGPTVNVLICALCSGAIAAWVGTLGAVPWNPLHPLLPVDASVVPTPGQMWLIRLFGVSYFLLLINMLPIFPFDGGRLLQAWLWQTKGYRASVEIATAVGMIGAIGIGLLALFTGEPWLLLMIAVYGYMTCWQTRRMAREHEAFETTDFGYDLDGPRDHGTTQESPTRRHSYLGERRARRAALCEERERKEHAARQQKIEDILRKIAQSGMQSVSPQERHILEEETSRRRELAGGRQPDDIA